MTKLRILAATIVATATIGIGLAAAPSASAMPMSCSQALKLANVYLTHSAVGNSVGASYWAGKASGILAGAC